MALTFLLWRALQLEARARAVELEKAEILAERILRQARNSRAVFERLPAAQRLVCRDGRVEIDGAVGWLEPVPAAEDADLVVQDRLDRAARAEFTARDHAAAAAQYDELLVGPLQPVARLQVLAAAAWQARRAGDAARGERFTAELERRFTALPLRDLGRRTVAEALVSALRLAGELPAWSRALVPALPPEAAAAVWANGVPADAGGLPAQQRAIAARRALLLGAQSELTRNAPRVTGPAGWFAVDAAVPTVLWYLARADGALDAALASVADWLQAVQAAGRDGALPEWPWLVEAELRAGGGREPDPAEFAGVPGLAGLRPSAASALDDRPWLLPAVTFALLLAFAVAAQQRFRATRREAAAVRAQAEFLTTVTHELKTPLASIRLLAEMLAEGRARGREDDYYRMLAGEAGRLSMLIENVLDLGRMERGERAYDLRPVDVGEVVRETLALFAPLVVQHGRQLVHRDGLAGGAAVGNLDRGALVQALISVLDNARKYGGGPLQVTAAREDDRAVITVRDHGPGIAAAERERIFERFVRGSPQAHGSTPGLGIGLYLARAIVRRLGGELRCVDPADGGPGAQFAFTLPLQPSP